jgi:hypothetical protein
LCGILIIFSGKSAARKVFIYRGKMMYVSPSLRVETTVDKVLANFAPHVTSQDEVIQVLDNAGSRFLNEIEPSQGYVNEDFDPTKVSLALMDQLQVKSMEQDLKMLGADLRPAIEMPITFRQFGELYLSPVIEVPQDTVPVTEIMCAAMEVQPNDLYDIGLNNLKHHVEAGGIHVETSPNGVRSIDCDHPPASSLFLSKEFWGGSGEKAGLSACDPHCHWRRDHVCAVAGRKAMAALGPKWDYGSRIGLFPKPMSKDTFIWSDGTFKVA